MINLLLICSYWVGNVVRLPLFASTSISFIDLCIGLIFLLNIPYFYRHRKILSQQKLFKATAQFLIVALASLLVASPLYSFSQLFIGSLYLVRILCCMSMLFVPFHFSFRHIRILIGGFVLLGFMQYILYPNLRYLLYLGWDDHYLRLFGSLLDPNFSGVLFVLMGLTLLIRPDGKKSELIDYVIALMIFGALLLTYSRSAYIIAFIAALSLTIAKKKLHYLLILLLIFASGLVLLPKKLPSEGVDLLRTASISARAHEYKKATQIIKDNPLLGIGYNTYRYARESYFGQEPSQFPAHAAAGVPNSYLFILATTGIIGFTFFINWLGALWNEYARRSAVAIPLLVAYMCSGLFDNTLVYPFIMLWVLLVLKQTEFAEQSSSNDKSNNNVGNAK